MCGTRPTGPGALTALAFVDIGPGAPADREARAIGVKEGGVGLAICGHLWSQPCGEKGTCEGSERSCAMPPVG